MLLAAIDEFHKGTYDFFYLPIDFKVLDLYYIVLLFAVTCFDAQQNLIIFSPRRTNAMLATRSLT